MSRIASVFSTGRKAFVPFLMAGDPDAATALEFLQRLPEAGADIIEIGVPFSDPAADGPVIEAAGLCALAQGTTLTSVLAMVTEFRRSNTHTPLVLMGYYNPIYRYGVERFARDAAAAGVDGLIIVDLPPEEEAEVVRHLTPLPLGEVNEHRELGEGSPTAAPSPEIAKAISTSPGGRANIDLIRLIAPTTPKQRQQYITQHASGFVYYISVKGITGGQSAAEDDLRAAINTLKAHTTLPVAAGFGIKTPAQAAQAAKIADAVVVGSALVQKLHEDGLEAALVLAKQLADAVHYAG